MDVVNVECVEFQVTERTTLEPGQYFAVKLPTGRTVIESGEGAQREQSKQRKRQTRSTTATATNETTPNSASPEERVLAAIKRAGPIGFHALMSEAGVNPAQYAKATRSLRRKREIHENHDKLWVSSVVESNGTQHEARA